MSDPCWRCEARPAAEGSSLCGRCREWLLSEELDAPPPQTRPPFLNTAIVLGLAGVDLDEGWSAGAWHMA